MNSIHRILIDYRVGTEQLFYLLLTRDGELHRRGSLSPFVTENHLLIAQDLAKNWFPDISDQIDPEWLKRAGRYHIGVPGHPVRTLVFGFQLIGGSEVILEFISSTTVPTLAPPDLLAFMQYLADLTQQDYDRLLIS